MVDVQKIIAELKIGGYLDAAQYIERQFATLNRTAEFGYMKAFIIEGDFTEDVYRTQLLALWTAYCLHQNLVVDTMGYDDDLLGLCRTVKVALYLCRPLVHHFAHGLEKKLFKEQIQYQQIYYYPYQTYIKTYHSYAPFIKMFCFITSGRR